jgi:signal transduction histidine kinase
VTLFLATVLLPCAVLVFLTVRSMRQERELASKRLADDQARMALEVQRALHERLDIGRTRALAVHASAAGKRPSTEDVVRLVAMVDSGRLVLPWQRPRASQPAVPVADKLRAADDEEFARRNPAGAVPILDTLIATTVDARDIAFARLALARVLTKVGRPRGAELEYRRLLSSDLSVADEQGIPFAAYAAAHLASSEAGLVLKRMAGLPAPLCCSTRAALAPQALYMLRDALHLALQHAPGNAPRVADLPVALETAVHDAERSDALAQALPTLSANARAMSDSAGASSSWVVYGSGSDAWAVSWIPATSGSDTLVALDVGPVLEDVNRSLYQRTSIAMHVRVAEAGEPSAQAFGPGLAGFRVDLPPSLGVARMTALARLSYAGMLALALGVTFFGAYLIWLDVRRELRLADLRSQFVASVSHELKTPLTAIRMFAETMLIDPSQDAERGREYLETIVHESERLTRLLNNVLDFSQIDRGEKAYRFTPTALGDVVDRAARTMEYPLSQLGFRLRVTSDGANPSVDADEDALQQAVLNLLANAIKYSGDRRDIDLRLQRVNGEAIIEVEDHGVGVAPAHVARLAEKFFRAPTPENARIPGTGLGLTLVDHIASAHGGRLRIDSQLGHGSVFAIHLPISASVASQP